MYLSAVFMHIRCWVQFFKIIIGPCPYKRVRVGVFKKIYSLKIFELKQIMITIAIEFLYLLLNKTHKKAEKMFQNIQPWLVLEVDAAISSGSSYFSRKRCPVKWKNLLCKDDYKTRDWIIQNHIFCQVKFHLQSLSLLRVNR